MHTDLNLAWQLISYFEGFSATAYKNPGENHYTIGFGRTGADVKAGDVTSKAKEEAWVLDRLKRWDAHIRAKLNTRLLTDYQMAVLVSFAYNVGLNGFLGSSVYKEIKNGNLYLVPDRLKLWVKGSDGRVLPGLVKRRGIEGIIWSTGKLPVGF